jgi:hypothetical protein
MHKYSDFPASFIRTILEDLAIVYSSYFPALIKTGEQSVAGLVVICPWL